MREFQGCRRRIYLWLPKGRMAHLRRHTTKTTGPVSFCGRVGGTETSWRDAKALELCTPCGRLAGIAQEAA